MAAKRSGTSILLDAFMPHWEIAKRVGVSVRTVERIKNRKDNGGTLDDKSRSGRPAKVNVEIILNIAKAFKTLISAIDKSQGLHKSTVGKALKKLGVKRLRKIALL